MKKDNNCNSEVTITSDLKTLDYFNYSPKNVRTYKTLFYSHNVMEVEVGAKPSSGNVRDALTYIRLQNDGYDMKMNIDNDKNAVEIIVGGDAEIETLIHAFRFMANVLEVQTHDTDLSIIKERTIKELDE